MSSSLPLSFNPPPSWQKWPTFSSDFSNSLFSLTNFSKHSSSISLSKSHICFAFSNNGGSNYEREEARWLREEQRWMREEQRWLRQEARWEAEREALVGEIEALKGKVEELRRQGGGGGSSVSSVANLLQVLKKEVSQIAESGSGAAPLVVEAEAEAAAAAAAVEEEDDDVEEVVVKEVVRVSEEVKKTRTTLRVGSEGDKVRELQEALQKLGFYSGEEDMEFASFLSGTERAVKTWQASIGVPETGMVTSELLEILYMDQQEGISCLKDVANGAAVPSVTQIPEVKQSVAKEDRTEGEHRVFLLGENRWEDSSRLKGRNKPGSQSQTNRKNVMTKCLTCRGEGRLMCVECDGTGEPNIEPQFLEWVGEDMKCPYCEGQGYTVCDVCQGKTVIGA